MSMLANCFFRKIHIQSSLFGVSLMVLFAVFALICVGGLATDDQVTPITRLLYSAGPRSPIQAFNILYAANALKIGYSKAEKERVLTIIQNSFERFKMQNPLIGPGYEMYAFLEADLRKNNLLLDSSNLSFTGGMNGVASHKTQKPNPKSIKVAPLPPSSQLKGVLSKERAD